MSLGPPARSSRCTMTCQGRSLALFAKRPDRHHTGRSSLISSIGCEAASRASVDRWVDKLSAPASNNAPRRIPRHAILSICPMCGTVDCGDGWNPPWRLVQRATGPGYPRLPSAHSRQEHVRKTDVESRRRAGLPVITLETGTQTPLYGSRFPRILLFPDMASGAAHPVGRSGAARRGDDWPAVPRRRWGSL